MLTIVNKTTNFIKTVVFERKTLYATVYWMSSCMKFNSCYMYGRMTNLLVEQIDSMVYDSIVVKSKG